MGIRQVGTVNAFDVKKGEGVIIPAGGGKPLWFFSSDIDQDDRKSLPAGLTVSFETRLGPKGDMAYLVRAEG
jgi:cold shock CspA family protein